MFRNNLIYNKINIKIFLYIVYIRRMETQTLKIKAAKPDLNQKTLVNYNNLFKRLNQVIGNKDLEKMSVDEICKYINEVKTKTGGAITPSVKASLLNVALVLKEVEDKDDPEIKKIKDERKKLNGDVKNHIVEVTNVALKDKLPSVKELNTYLQSLYEKQSWRAFIVNFLLMNYGTRNKDLNLEFISDKKEKLDPKKNYLIVDGKNKIIYQRGDYKTVKTYGGKIDEIKDKKFSEAVKEVMANQDDNRYLLSLGKNKPIAETSLNRFISRYTLNDIGQGNVFKIMVAGKPKLKEVLAATRGTEEKTVSEVYDLNHKDEKGKAKKRGLKGVQHAKEEAPKETEALKEILEEKPKPKARAKKFKIIKRPEPKVADKLEEDWSLLYPLNFII